MRHDIPKYSVLTVEKTVALLGLLAGERSQTLQSLADRLDLSRNKAFRIVMTLEHLGLVKREEPGGTYRFGMAALELAQKVLNNSSIINHAHPVMEELAHKHGEAVYMTVLEGEEVLFIDMVDCDRQVKAVPLVGRRFPFFKTAAGKAIKALESRDLRERLFKGRKRQRELPDFDCFESELDVILKTGVAVDTGGLGDGIISVAVAVRDYAGKAVGAITLLGPSFRMLKERVEEEIIPSLLEGGEILSGKFGYARI